MKKAILLYMPVVHQGYISLIERHLPADVILINGKSLESIDPVIADRLTRDIRCIPAEGVAVYLDYKFPSTKIRTLKVSDDVFFLEMYDNIVALDEDISYAIKKVLPETIRFHFDDQFLRWDWSQTNIPKSVTDGQFPVTTNEQDRFFMQIAEFESFKSSDIWRRVGALVPYGDNKSLVTFNKHMPTNDAPYINGDPRLNMKPGEKPDICSAIHAEASLISAVARIEGVSLEGKSIYVTTFPCPVCARMIVESGIRKVFFKEGYSVMLDAADVLVYAGVEIFQVK